MKIFFLPKVIYHESDICSWRGTLVSVAEPGSPELLIIKSWLPKSSKGRLFCSLGGRKQTENFQRLGVASGVSLGIMVTSV